MANPRIPDNVHKLKNTFEKHRHGDPSEKVQLEDKAPEPPSWIGREAKREWRRICKILKGKGVIAELDRPLLTQYCVLWEQLYRSVRPRKVGRKMVIGSFTASDHAQMRLLGTELGIGAISRSKIVTKPKSEESQGGDDWDDL